MLRKKRDQRRRAASALGSSPYGLLSPLNRAPQSRRARELVELVRTLQEIERIEAALAEAERQLLQDPNYEGAGVRRAPFHLYVQANEILSACHWSPRVAPPPNEPHSFTWNATTHESDWENKFVSWILNLRARGDLSLIRSCRNCGRWFHAVTNHQTNCTDRCRQDFHSKDKSFKEKRRLYMRRYRKAEKAQNWAAKQLVKIPSRVGEVAPRKPIKKGGR